MKEERKLYLIVETPKGKIFYDYSKKVGDDPEFLENGDIIFPPVPQWIKDLTFEEKIELLKVV